MKKLKLYIFIILFIFLFTGCKSAEKEALPTETEKNQESQPNNTPAGENEYDNDLAIGDAMPVSRGLAAKMAVFMFNDLNEIKTADREIKAADTSPSYWYDKYMNLSVIEGFIPEDEVGLRPEDSLTITEAQNLLDKINPQNNIKIKIDEENKDKAISYALWCRLYEETLKAMAGEESLMSFFEIQEEFIIPLVTSGSNSILPEGYVITDKGPFSCDGIALDTFIDKKIRVLIKDNEIIAASAISEETPVIKNAYIVSASSDSLLIFCGGAEREYNYKNSLKEPAGKICNIKVSGNTILDFELIEEKIEGTIKSVSTEELYLSEKGRLKLSDDFKVYSLTDGPVKWKKIKDLTVGTDLAGFFLKNGFVEAAVINKIPEPLSIRVAIKTSDFSSFYHKDVVLSGTKGLSVTLNGEKKEYGPNEKVTLSPSDAFKAIAYVEPVEDGRISLESISRSGSIPVYRGNMEVSPYENGLVIINELPLEEYLYSVVPSEMPNSYGLEALKVQAVTARSYAYNQFYANHFHEYGANVCDSVISQVYNNVAETPLSIQAVKETEGQVLKYQNAVISANFFSTSSGITANNGEVWMNSVTKEFPSDTTPYLASVKQYTQGDYGDLSKEENAAKFFKSTDVKAHDSFSDWFRWKVTMTREEIEASINANLSQIYADKPKLVKTLQPDGSYKSRPVETIGKLLNIEVTERGQSGNIMTMKFTGDKNTILVSTEYNIRSLIRPKQYIEGEKSIIIERHNNTQIADYSLMPSAFFTMERMTLEDGTIKYVNFYGGGNGHGVGMSQTGVKGMVDEGYAFNDILSHFYNGTTVEKIY